MIIENRLESRSFGPFASSTGIFLLAGGLITSFFTLFGLIIAITGAFMAFTSTFTIIDTEKRRVKHADYMFGMFPLGKWIDIQPGMKLGVKMAKKGYTGYIRGTQPYDIRYHDIRIILYGDDNKQIIPIKKFKTSEEAKAELNEYSSLLGLTIT